MDLVVHPSGHLKAIYAESLDFTLLGEIKIQRASHVEPDGDGRWWADLAPACGPKLGPFSLRSEALAAEINWLSDRLASLPVD